MLQTFHKMPEIPSDGPLTLIHFEQSQRPFDFQCSPAERKVEVTPVFECVCVTVRLLCRSNVYVLVCPSRFASKYASRCLFSPPQILLFLKEQLRDMKTLSSGAV